MDFTLATYAALLTALRDANFSLQTFAEFMNNPLDRAVVIRHDVDKLPGNALRMAKLEHGMGIKATYYFRAVPVSWDEEIIKEIARTGHEGGKEAVSCE